MWLAVAWAACRCPESQAGFPQGVACGDVTGTSAVLWTRSDAAREVVVEVAEDPAFAAIVATQTAEADPQRDLTVKVVVAGLEPGREYFYRFRDDAESATGRFRTLPREDDVVGLRFLFSGDSEIGHGPFFVLGDAAESGVDLAIWGGDTIYGDVPAGDLGVAVTLEDYRAKYRQVRSDPNLRAFLASMSVRVVWDDHEVVNDYAGGDPATASEERKAGAYTAFFEHQPVAEDPSEPFRTYRRFRWGRLAEFFLLDVRQYREASAAAECGFRIDPFGLLVPNAVPDEACVAALRRRRSMLGQEQLAWLLNGLRESEARYKFVFTGVVMSFLAYLPYDRWDGYDYERKQILEFIDRNRIENVWFLATDAHLNLFNPDVGRYFRRHRPDYDLRHGVVMREMVTGPIAEDTLFSGAVERVEDILAADDNLVLDFALATTFQGLANDIARRNGFALFEPNRYAYALVDVPADGPAVVEYRGVRPEENTAVARVRTFYRAREDGTPLNPPCFVLPLLAAGGAALGLAGRHRRGQRPR